MDSKMAASSESEYSDEESSDRSKSLARQYKCPNCPYTSLSLKSHQKHLRSHLSCYSAYECKECLVSFHLRDVYLQHKKEERSKKLQSEKSKLNLVCSTCKKPFHTRCAFNRHQLRHQGLPYKCPLCKETFTSVSSRSRHVKNHVIMCVLCNVYFQDHSALIKHVSAVHRSKGGKIEPIAPVLPENIPMSSVKSEEGERNCVCFVCEQRFATEGSMKAHMRGHKLFCCSECPRFFPCSSHLQEHKLCHRKETNNSECEVYQPGTIAQELTFSEMFSTEDLDKSEKPMLDFDNLMHFSWLMKFTQDIQCFDLPLSIPVSEKLTHVISLLNIQLTYSSGLIDMGKNFKYFAYILKVLSAISTDHFLELAKLKE